MKIVTNVASHYMSIVRVVGTGNLEFVLIVYLITGKRTRRQRVSKPLEYCLTVYKEDPDVLYDPPLFSKYEHDLIDIDVIEKSAYDQVQTKLDLAVKGLNEIVDEYCSQGCTYYAQRALDKINNREGE